MTPAEQRAATLKAITGAIYDDKTLSIVACWELISIVENAYDMAIGGNYERGIADATTTIERLAQSEHWSYRQRIIESARQNAKRGKRLRESAL